jgi:hypothetical protein
MAMQDSAQIPIGNEPGQFRFQGSLDFSAPLAHFRLDEGQSESAVNVLLLDGNHGGPCAARPFRAASPRRLPKPEVRRDARPIPLRTVALRRRLRSVR